MAEGALTRKRKNRYLTYSGFSFLVQKVVVVVVLVFSVASI